MKKIFTLALASILFVSCSSDDDSGPALSSTPEAKAQYDDSSLGIYKGVFVGSSGVVFIDVNNNGVIEADLTIDGAHHHFTTTDTAGDGENANITFTSGSMSFDFYVDGDGLDPYVYNINFAGHPDAEMRIMKEYSDSLVEVFQGTYNGDDSGAFNIIIQGNEIYGLGRSNDGGSFYLTGVRSSTQIGGYFDGGSFTGTKNGNGVSGNWENDFGEAGGFSGQRKL